jgi:hypothetical protein
MFRIPKTRAWDPNTNELEADSRLQVEVYVLAILAHGEKPTLNPLDVSQWRFYVVPTSTLDTRTRSQHSITLRSLEKIGLPVDYRGLAVAVKNAYDVHRGTAPLSRGLISELWRGPTTFLYNVAWGISSVPRELRT